MAGLSDRVGLRESGEVVAVREGENQDEVAGGLGTWVHG